MGSCFLRAIRDSLGSLLCECVFTFKLSESGEDTGDYGKVYVILYLKNAACMLLDYAEEDERRGVGLGDRWREMLALLWCIRLHAPFSEIVISSYNLRDSEKSNSSSTPYIL